MQTLQQSPRQTDSRPQHAARRPLRLCAMVVFVPVLVLATACGVRPSAHVSRGSQVAQGPTSLPPTGSHGTLVCLPPAQPSPAGGCIVQDAATGISLRLVNAYADVTSTVVRLETTNTPGYPLDIWQAQLALPSGRSLMDAGGQSGGGASFTVYEPVPSEEVSPLVHLVATAHFRVRASWGLTRPPLPPAPSWLSALPQLALSLPFALTPVRSGGYLYHQAPIVEHGIAVQVQSLAFASGDTAFYGSAGGASIELLVSGLPADIELLSFIRLESRESITGATEGDLGPGLLDLLIPGMTVSTPMITILQSPAWPNDSGVPSVDPTVGAAGTVHLEVSYQGGGVPSGQPAVLTISQIQLLTGGIDGNTGTPPTLPMYQITLLVP
jgi:hypothetical protein